MRCSEKQMGFAQNIGNCWLCEIWHWNRWYVCTYLVVLWPHTFLQAPPNPGGSKICLRGVSKNNCQASGSGHPFFMKFVKKLQLSYRVWRQLWNKTARCCADLFDTVLGIRQIFVSRSACCSSCGVVLRSVITGRNRQQTGWMAAGDEGRKCELRSSFCLNDQRHRKVCPAAWCRLFL